jgi:hypothetical protein
VGQGRRVGHIDDERLVDARTISVAFISLTRHHCHRRALIASRSQLMPRRAQRSLIAVGTPCVRQ